MVPQKDSTPALSLRGVALRGSHDGGEEGRRCKRTARGADCADAGVAFGTHGYSLSAYLPLPAPVPCPVPVVGGSIFYLNNSPRSFLLLIGRGQPENVLRNGLAASLAVPVVVSAARVFVCLRVTRSGGGASSHRGYGWEKGRERATLQELAKSVTPRGEVTQAIAPARGRDFAQASESLCSPTKSGREGKKVERSSLGPPRGHGRLPGRWTC